MKKILIADDDFPIRDWLAKCCRDIISEEDVEICTAANGEIALNEFMKDPADILFADIKMPLMDGLELLEKIRESYEKNVYIVVLSSYDDFNYARTAFKNKVNEYVLKAEITIEYMRDIIERAGKWLESGTEEHLSGAYSLEQMTDEIKDKQSKNDKLAVLKKYNIKVPSGPFFCVANYNINKTYNSMKIIQENNIHKVFGMRADKAEITCFTISGVDSMLYQFQKVNMFIKKLSAMNGSQIICYGKITTDSENLLYYATDVVRGLAYRYYSDVNVFFTENIRQQLENYSNIEPEVINIYTKILNIDDRSNYSTITSLISEWIDLICEYKVLDIAFVKQMAQKIYSYLEVGETGKNINDELNVIKKIDNIEKIKELKDIISEAYIKDLEKSIKLKSKSSVIQKALKYIYADYANITGLSEIADHVGLNREYFSRLFKEEMGVNLSVFLNDYKLDMAMNMITHTDKKIYEIAEETGFSSLSYFSRKFKEKFNKTPFAYRK